MPNPYAILDHLYDRAIEYHRTHPSEFTGDACDSLHTVLTHMEKEQAKAKAHKPARRRK